MNLDIPAKKILNHKFIVEFILLASITIAFGLDQPNIFSFFALPFHELGHSIIANLGGIPTIPTPFNSISLTQERSYLFIILTQIVFMIFIWKAYSSSNLKTILVLAASIALTLTLSFITEIERLWEIIIFFGLAGELVISLNIVIYFIFCRQALAYNGRAPLALLAISCFVFCNRSIFWLQAEASTEYLPFGAMLDFALIENGESSGDLDRLIRDYSWDLDKIVRIYQLTTHACICLLIGACGLNWFFISSKMRSQDNCIINK